MSLVLKIDQYPSIQNALDELSLTLRPEYFTPKEIVEPPMPLWSVYSTFGKAKLAPAEWSMLPNWDNKKRITRPLTIARVETVHERVSYKNLIRRYKALIPINGFSVRSQSRNKFDLYNYYSATHKNEKALFLAALYQFNVDGNMQVVVLTRGERVESLKKTLRLPLVIQAKDVQQWLETEKISIIDNLFQQKIESNLSFSKQ